MAFKQSSGGFRGNDRGGSFGGRGGNDRGGDRPHFANKGFSGGGHGGHDRDARPVQMHSATCAKCNKTCEVPFRPNGERPVFCKDCFGSQRDSFGGDNRRSDSSERSFPKREFTPSSSFAPTARPVVENAGLDELKRLVESMGKKLDTLLAKMAEGHARTPVVAVGEKAKPEAVKEVVKETVKKAKVVAKKVAKKVKK